MNDWDFTEPDSYFKRTAKKLTKVEAIKKDCRSILLADKLEKLGYTLYRDTFGYKVKKNEFEVIVKNLDKLELFINIL